MDGTYLAPTDFELSYSSPFKSAFGDKIGNGDETFAYASNGQGNDTLDLLQNGLQQLGISDPEKSVSEEPQITPTKLVSNNSNPPTPKLESTMGVAESKENIIEEIPSYINYDNGQPHRAEKPNSPKSVAVADVQPHSIFSPMPMMTAKGDQYQNPTRLSLGQTSPNSYIRQQEAEAKAQQQALDKLEEELAKQEALFVEQIAEADKTLSDREKELNSLHAKIEAAKTENEANANEKKAEKYEAKVSALKTELEAKKSDFKKTENVNKQIVNEREQIYDDLLGVENAYSDLMRKYLRAKESIMSYHETEQSLKARDNEMLDKMKLKDQKFVMMQAEVQESLEQIYQEYEANLSEKKCEHENLRVRLMRMEMRAATLEKDLEQKSKENAQLHALCDDIINGRVNR